VHSWFRGTLMYIHGLEEL